MIITRLWILLTIASLAEAKRKNQTYVDGGYLKTCPRPLPPSYALISALSASRYYEDTDGSHGLRDYLEHDKIYFQCKVGYSQVDITSVMYITCGSNGKWFPSVEKVGRCVDNSQISQCSRGLFRCKTSRKCISRDKRCNCVNDCDDGSDEADCRERRQSIRAPSWGRDNNGVITSPGFPMTYPENYSCTYYISTMKNHHVELFFERFDLPRRNEEGVCEDYVQMDEVHAKYVTLTPFKQPKRCADELSYKYVYSNKSKLAVKVSLGAVKTNTHFRGYSITWRVRSRKYIASKFSNEKKVIPVDDTESNNIHTILTPIAITALLPLFLILFLCCHKRIRWKSNEDKQPEADANQNTMPMLLTEESLTSGECCELKLTTQITTTQQHQILPMRETPAGIESESRIVREYTRHQAPQPCDFTKQLQNNRSSYNSANSNDELRYVRSYDLSLQQENNQRFPTSSSSSSSNRSRPCKCKRGVLSKHIKNGSCSSGGSSLYVPARPNRLIPIGCEFPEYREPPNSHLQYLTETNFSDYDVDSESLQNELTNEYRDEAFKSFDECLKQPRYQRRTSCDFTYLDPPEAMDSSEHARMYDHIDPYLFSHDVLPPCPA